MKITTEDIIVKYSTDCAKLNGAFLEIKVNLKTRFDDNYIRFLEQKHMYLQSNVSNTFMHLRRYNNGIEKENTFKKMENLVNEYKIFISGLQTILPCFKGNVR